MLGIMEPPLHVLLKAAEEQHDGGLARDMVIANGRTLGDALGCCTFFADNGEGCSNVDLAVVSS